MLIGVAQHHIVAAKEYQLLEIAMRDSTNKTAKSTQIRLKCAEKSKETVRALLGRPRTRRKQWLQKPICGRRRIGTV